MVNVPRSPGIYKIVSPSNNVYIGQSINLYRRFQDYKNKLAKKQPALFRSFKKYGISLHKFEIIHDLPVDITQKILNEYECLYMEMYISCGVVLLNVKEGGSNGRNSDESIKKANDKWKDWYKKSDIAKQLASKLGSSNKGKKLTSEHIDKLSKIRKGKKKSEQHRRRISEGNSGKKMNFTKEQKDAFVERTKAYVGNNRIMVVQYSISGDFIKEWSSATKAQEQIGVSRKLIQRCCKGTAGNAGGYIWAYKGSSIDIDNAIRKTNPTPKKINQYTLDGVFVKTCDSQTAAAKSVGSFTSAIGNCAKGKSKTAGGFKWEFAVSENPLP